jgi:hypothetical protein
MLSRFAPGLLLVAALPGQSQPESLNSVRVVLSADSPVSLLGNEWNASRVSDRGGAQVLNLAGQLQLKNGSHRRIRAITWLVQTHDNTPGGRASVTKASLDVNGGETFPLRVDLRLLRPLVRGAAPEIEVSLDGVLFDDLSFYGPNVLDSRRVMMAFEMEAQRDRKHFLSVLQARGAEGLRAECMVSLARQASMPRLDVQMARAGRATNASPAETEKKLEFAFLRFPDSPVEAVSGMAGVLGAEARSPKIEVWNRSQRGVRYVEVGWLLRDTRGREYLAGAVPAKAILAPGQKTQIVEPGTLRFAEATGGTPVSIEGLTGFVNQVEFADGTVWVPSRSALSDPNLEKALAPSAEEQRLTNLYRKKGLTALMDELKRFAR